MRVCRPEFVHSCGRSSVLWQVSQGAQEADTAGRLLLLAQHKIAPQAFEDKADRWVTPWTRETGG